MKKNYRINVKVEIEECEGDIDNKPCEIGDGSFEFKISEEDACSIDICEKAVLRTNYEAIRRAVSKHLTEVSKKKALRSGYEGELIEDEHLYQVEGEIGRFTFTTHSIKSGDDILYSTRRDVFCEIGGREWYKTSGFKEIAMVYGCIEESYRKTSELINRIRYQEGATPVRTLQYNTEEEGRIIGEYIRDKALNIIRDKGFTEEGEPLDKSVFNNSEMSVLMSEERVERVINEREISFEGREMIKKNPVGYEDVEQTVNISIDDVGVKKQKETRENKDVESSDDGKEYIHNTVVHIQKGDSSYILNGYGIVEVLKCLIMVYCNIGFSSF